MTEYIVLVIIVMLVAGIVLWLCLSKGKRNDKSAGTAGDSVSGEDDLQALRQFLDFLDEEEKPQTTKAFSGSGEGRKESRSETADPAEAGTAEKETSDQETEYQENGEEEDDTMPFLWPSEEEEKKVKGDPVLDYRIILNGNITEGSLYDTGDEYLIGKDRDLDLVLETRDPVVGKKFLKLRRIREKELFLLEPFREGWTIPVWSEEEGRWKPQTGRIMFGMEECVTIALTQFGYSEEKTISRLELAMPGCLEQREDDMWDIGDDPEDDGDLFDI